MTVIDDVWMLSLSQNLEWAVSWWWCRGGGAGTHSSGYGRKWWCSCECTTHASWHTRHNTLHSSTNLTGCAAPLLSTTPLWPGQDFWNYLVYIWLCNHFVIGDQWLEMMILRIISGHNISGKEELVL